MGKRYLVLVVLLLSLVPTLSAQTVCESNCVVAVGQSFIAFTEHDPEIWNYQLFINGQPSGVNASFMNGFVEFYHPGFSQNTNLVLVIYAQTQTGQIQYTDSLNVSVSRRKIRIRK
jgi:hypothetical protein